MLQKIERVTGTLSTVIGNELKVVGETNIRFRLPNSDCFWPVMITRGPSHDCILGSGSIFFSNFNVKSTMIQEPLFSRKH